VISSNEQIFIKDSQDQRNAE